MKAVVKAAVTTGGAAALGIVFAAVTGKIISVVAGPSGIGLYSVLMQIYATAVAFASFGGGGYAIVQGVASRTGRDRDRFIVTAGWIHVATALIVAAAVLVAAPAVPKLLGVEHDLLDSAAIRSVALAVLLGTLVVYLSGLVNAFREIAALAQSRIWASMAPAMLAYPAALLVRAGSQVAFVGLICSGLIVQAIALAGVVSRKGLFAGRRFFERDLVASESVRHFSKVAGTYFLAGQLAQVGMLAITAAVIRSSELQGAGWLNVSITISTGYLMLILGSFGTYYAPTVAAAADTAGVRTVIRDVMRVSMMASVPIIVAIIVLKPLLIMLFYTREFLPSLKVLRWMLIGDYLKIFSWVFAMPLSARAVLKVFLIGEVAMIVLYYASSLALLPIVGSPEGVGVAFALSYGVYLLFHVWYARIRWQFAPTSREALVWGLGLALVVGASISHWNTTDVRVLESGAWILAALLFSWWGLGSVTRGQAVELIRRRLGR